MTKLLSARVLPCKCGGDPVVKGDQRTCMTWLECGRCGRRTSFYARRSMAIEAWNREQAKWYRPAPEPPEIKLAPIEGRKDCRHYVGFVGIIHGKETPIPQAHGVMHCSHHEYQNAICGVKSPIGGILTDHCEKCKHYEPKEKEE